MVSGSIVTDSGALVLSLLLQVYGETAISDVLDITQVEAALGKKKK
jgi:hypothetical protein